MTRWRWRLLRSARHDRADDGDEYDEVDDDDDEDEERSEPEVTIEISGLSLFTHVGVTAAEREVGQRLLLDLRLDVGECDATITDRIEDTVDYAEVCDMRQPRRPAAHLQDARAAVRGDRRSAARAVRRAVRCGSRRPSPSRRWRSR